VATSRTKPKDDLYAASIHIADYADALREAGALDGLSLSDASKVADQIGVLAYKYRFIPGSTGLDDKRHIEELYNRSMNARYLADGENWHDPARVSRAFAAAKSALTPKLPQNFPFWTVDPAPKEDPTC